MFFFNLKLNFVFTYFFGNILSVLNRGELPPYCEINL